jgi:hypothetical protein
MTKTAGWEVANKEVNEGVYLLTVKMTSVDPCSYNEELHDQLHNELIAHTHRSEVSSGLFTFDHDPTTEEVEAAVVERGFNPVLQDVDRGITIINIKATMTIHNNNTSIHIL